MTGDSLNNLRVVLLALLPSDGSPMTVSDLAKATVVDEEHVTSALMDDYLHHRIDFDVRTDSYSAKKQGDAL